MAKIPDPPPKPVEVKPIKKPAPTQTTRLRMHLHHHLLQQVQVRLQLNRCSRIPLKLSQQAFRGVSEVKLAVKADYPREQEMAGEEGTDASSSRWFRKSDRCKS